MYGQFEEENSPQDNSTSKVVHTSNAHDALGASGPTPKPAHAIASVASQNYFLLARRAIDHHWIDKDFVFFVLRRKLFHIHGVGGSRTSPRCLWGLLRL